MSLWYWTILVLINTPVCVLAGGLIFWSFRDFFAAILNTTGMGARIWTMEDAEAESSNCVADLKIKGAMLIAVAAGFGEHILFKHWGWV